MASNINPNNIDTTYPVAGQDNDSQGFRDNFTNIKTNFSAAETEIDDLQAKVIVKSALTGTTIDNDFADAVVKAAQIKDFSETIAALGTTSGTLTLNHAASHYYTVTTNGNITVAFSNMPASGTKGRIQLAVTVGSTSHSMTLPSAVNKGTDGIAGYASNTVTFTKTGTYVFEFTTSDAGATIHIADLSRARLNNQYSSEDLAASGAASLTKDISYFTTAAAETATLAAGTEGQTKYFCMLGNGGDMVITVTNPSWTGSGTLTFDAIGDACTLLYTQSKWFVVGNNGVALG